MKANKYGELATKEHLAGGTPITRLEAMLLYGLSNLTTVIYRMRKQGWIIETRRIPFVAAVKRVNEFVVYMPPNNLPTKEIPMTDYWVSK